MVAQIQPVGAAIRGDLSCPVSEIVSRRQSRFHYGETQFYSLRIAVVDLVVATACLVVVSMLRQPGVLLEHLFVYIGVALLSLWIALYLIDGYNPRNNFVSLEYSVQHFLAVCAATALALFISVVILQHFTTVLPRRFNVPIAFLVFLPISWLYRRDLCSHLRRKFNRSVILFLGNARAARSFHDDLEHCGTGGNIVFATAGADETPPEGGRGIDQDMEIVPLDHDLMSRIGESISAVVCAEDTRSYRGDLIGEILRLRLASVPVYSLGSFYENRLRKVPLNVVKPGWILKDGFRIAHDPVFLQLKRALDILVSAVGLILASPLFLLATIAVKLTDGGPVFFRQTRIGLNCRNFQIVKFRTMSVGSENGDSYTRQNDSRVTKIGKYLRKWRLDELPQLWNVLIGDMSLIGPRAEWDKLVADYEREIPCYHFRHLVKPGVTGWAQVNYPYGSSLNDTKRKLEYDLYYIRNFSILLDGSIVFKTIYTMLFAKGQ